MQNCTSQNGEQLALDTSFGVLKNWKTDWVSDSATNSNTFCLNY